MGDEDRVLEWEDGLPTAEDLTPLSQHLIPPELASAFSITPEPYRSIIDVNRASQNTLTSLRGQSNQFNFKSFNVEREKEGDEVDADPDPDPKRRIDSSSGVVGGEEADSSARGQKRPRLVWTPQLHKRFVDVVAHLGIKNAVPKTIMQLMNVEGLTRENVASHLQKYRLYLKRMQGLSNEGPSSSDQLFASTPVPQSLHEPVPMQMPYAPQMMPMPVYGNYPYNMMQERDWSGNKFSYHHRITPNDN